MVKWKKISKRLAMLLMAVLVMVGTQTTAFAYTDQSAEATETKTESKPVSVDDVDLFDDFESMMEKF